MLLWSFNPVFAGLVHGIRAERGSAGGSSAGGRWRCGRSGECLVVSMTSTSFIICVSVIMV